MSESALAAPLHFTIEFLGFLVAAGGAVLVLSRHDLISGTRAARLLASLGFALIALAQVVHGASLGDGGFDDAEVLAWLATAGFAALLGAVLPTLRRSTRAAMPAAVTIRHPLLAAPAAVALLLGAVCFAGARGPHRAALRRLGVAAWLLAAAQALTALAPHIDIGTEVDAYAYAAHGVRLLGFLALGWWLWSSTRSSIRTRFVGAFAALLVVVVLVLSTALTGVISNNVTDSQREGISGQLSTATSNIRDQVDDLTIEVGQIAGLPDVSERLISGDATGLARAIQSTLQDFYTFDFVAVLDGRGAILDNTARGPRLKEGGPAKRLSNFEVLGIVGSPVVRDLRGSGRAVASLDVVPDSRIVAIIAGAPVDGRGHRPAGYVIVARYLDAVTVRDIGEASRPSNASLLIGKRVIASSFRDVTSDALVTPEVRDDVTAGVRTSSEQRIGGETYFAAFAPLRDARGLPTNATLVLSSPASVITETRAAVIKVLFLVALGVAVIVLLLAALSGRRITRPIQQLTAVAGAVREGDLTARAVATGDDEVGRLGATFNQMTAALKRTTDDLRGAARQEQSLRERIEAIIQSMADGLVAVDAEGRILAFNAEAEVMTGMDASDALGKPAADVIVVVDAQGERVALPLAEVAEGTTGGVFLERASRDPVPIAVTSTVLRDEEGQASGAVAVLRDMTREREIERMKTEFLSNVSHELRTPLTPIKGFAEILATSEIPTDKVQHFAAGIVESTARLDRIVAMLVDFSSMEAGRLAPGEKQVDVSAMIEKLAEEWRRRFSTHTFVADVGGELLSVLGDERLLRRSLEEIIDNAVKFSPDGGTITVAARTAESNGRTASVEVEVSDEGIGIEPEQLGRVFSDFQQLDGSQTRTFGGLGLGLAFVRRIVEAHSGSVDVTSEPRRGTRLTIRLPGADVARTH